MKFEMYIPENFLATGGCFGHNTYHITVLPYHIYHIITSTLWLIYLLYQLSVFMFHIFVTSEHKQVQDNSEKWYKLSC